MCRTDLTASLTDSKMFVSCLNVDPLGMHTVMACQNGKYRTSLDNITYFLEKARMQFFF